MFFSFEQVYKSFTELREFVLTNKPVLNIKEAANYCGVSPSHMRTIVHSKKVPHYKPHGKLLYFKRTELENWLLQNPQNMDAA